MIVPAASISSSPSAISSTRASAGRGHSRRPRSRRAREPLSALTTRTRSAPTVRRGCRPGRSPRWRLDLATAGPRQRRAVAARALEVVDLRSTPPSTDTAASPPALRRRRCLMHVAGRLRVQADRVPGAATIVDRRRSSPAPPPCPRSCSAAAVDLADRQREAVAHAQVDARVDRQGRLALHRASGSSPRSPGPGRASGRPVRCARPRSRSCAPAGNTLPSPIIPYACAEACSDGIDVVEGVARELPDPQVVARQHHAAAVV